MAVTIRQVLDSKSLKEFVDFPNKLYKGNKYFVPKLFFDEMNTLDSEKNPAFKFCEVALYLAYKDDKIVGRVAAIINNKANERWGHKEVRYGWLDFIDDKEVSAALIESVSEFGKRYGMEQIVGPLGFTDLDAEGMLVEGFDKMNTLFLLYNHPYYMEHFEAMGFTKQVDWLEYYITIPDKVPEKIEKVALIATERYGLKVKKLSRKEIKRGGYGHKIFDLVNQTYGKLYNFTILPENVINNYVDTYLSLIDLSFVTLVEDNDGNIVAFGISMPSIVRALQKSGGKLFPFGWFHLLKSLFFKKEENVELMLVGVLPEYRTQGALALIFNDLIPRYIKAGFKYGESNAELESNTPMISSWTSFETTQVKRRRVYGKQL